MKSIRNESEPSEIEIKFPLLAESSHKNYVVLFLNWHEGVVVQADKGALWQVGHYSTGWTRVTNGWRILGPSETVVLQND